MPNYVDNEKLYDALVEYKKLCLVAENCGDDEPPIPSYIAGCFLLIGEGLSSKPNFMNYTYKDDMVMDGVENCIRYCTNFNPEKSKNPFAYFTQIIYYAFLRRIAKEKKQSHVRNKMIERDAYDSFTTMEGDDSSYYVEGIDTKLFLPEDDVYKPKKKEPAKKKGLEIFMEKDT